MEAVCSEPGPRLVDDEKAEAGETVEEHRKPVGDLRRYELVDEVLRGVKKDPLQRTGGVRSEGDGKMRFSVM